MHQLHLVSVEHHIQLQVCDVRRREKVLEKLMWDPKELVKRHLQMAGTKILETGPESVQVVWVHDGDICPKSNMRLDTKSVRPINTATQCIKR